MPVRLLLLTACLLCVSLNASTAPLPPAVETGPAADQPNPATVIRCGPGYRYPQAGWVMLHIEGAPHARGFQHGVLLAPEIREHLKCLAAHHQPSAPGEGWANLRTLVNALFLRHFDREFLEEMQGIADGAASKDVSVEGHKVDLVDIVTLNVWAELMTLDGALGALPTGLEGVKFPDGAGKPLPKPPTGEHCSAFAATAPATADGKIVFGHISMYDLYPSSFFFVWLDIVPEKGHRIFMQTVPGGIQSGLDYYLNSAGLLVCETTISQSRYNPEGQAESSQIRKAVQYSDNIDALVAELKNKGNGLYSNEWLIGDTKTNEIAMFEQGTHEFKLWRSSKHEWFGGTVGFYWGDNNVKDVAVRMEGMSRFTGEPANIVYRPHERDLVWVELYKKYKGRIDADFGRLALTTPPLAAFTSADAKVTTTDMAKNMTSWALFGSPLGRVWAPDEYERKTFPGIRPLIPNPWTVVHALPNSPASLNDKEPVAVDLGGKRNGGSGGEGKLMGKGWHGSLLPKSDADYWLAVAFAEYQHFCKGEKNRADAGREMFGWRTNYFYGALYGGDTALTQLKPRPDDTYWYRIASSKGCMALHELRLLVGDPAFADAMNSFGLAHAGKEVSTEEFVAHVEKATGKKINAWEDYWLKQAGLPRLKLGTVTLSESADKAEKKDAKHYTIKGSVSAENGPLPSVVDVTLETEKGETTSTLSAPDFTLTSEQRPVRLTVNKYARNAVSNGAPYTLNTFRNDFEHAMIVYSTSQPACFETAKEMQTTLISHGPNMLIPLRSDKELTTEEIRSHNLVLVGRPTQTACRSWVQSLPIEFLNASFRVSGDLYAHPQSAVAVVAQNPCNDHLTAVLIEGLSANALYNAALRFARGESGNSEIAVFEAGGNVRGVVLPARELQFNFGKE